MSLRRLAVASIRAMARAVRSSCSRWVHSETSTSTDQTTTATNSAVGPLIGESLWVAAVISVSIRTLQRVRRRVLGGRAGGFRGYPRKLMGARQVATVAAGWTQKGGMSPCPPGTTPNRCLLDLLGA